MSEFEPKGAASTDFQLEALIAEVESKYNDAEDALSGLRLAVRRLKAYRPLIATPSTYSIPPVQADAPTAPFAAPEPSAHGAAQVDREEVSRIVAETRAEIQGEVRPSLEEETVGLPFWPGPKKAEPAAEKFRFVESYGMDSTSEASWPISKPASPISEPEDGVEQELPEAPIMEPEPLEASAPSDDDEARRDEVARIVAQMRDSGDEEEESPAEPEPHEDEAVERRDVAKMVAELRDSVDVEAEASANGAGEPEADEEARRLEVARMVAELRNAEAGPEDEGADESDDKAALEDAASMAAEVGAEIDVDAPSGLEEPAPEGEESDEEVREEVRRAVESARAELATGYKDPKEDHDAAGESRFSFPDWQTTHMEPSGPPVIVIKDSEGRVELARVYETLSEVDCDENAALLNYTPHSVTVGLNSKATVPSMEAMEDAVRLVFGRACEVDSDGVRVNVQIGKDLKGKDSAA